MPFCTQCGSESAAGQKFCSSCGTAFAGAEKPTTRKAAAPKVEAEPVAEATAEPVYEFQPTPKPSSKRKPLLIIAPIALVAIAAVVLFLTMGQKTLDPSKVSQNLMTQSDFPFGVTTDNSPSSLSDTYLIFGNDCTQDKAISTMAKSATQLAITGFISDQGLSTFKQEILGFSSEDQAKSFVDNFRTGYANDKCNAADSDTTDVFSGLTDAQTYFGFGGTNSVVFNDHFAFTGTTGTYYDDNYLTTVVASGKYVIFILTDSDNTDGSISQQDMKDVTLVALKKLLG
ncbi:MAG: hypothetical protein RL719_244 [Actinomycetota bacterium]|jgi:hypothetical protein